MSNITTKVAQTADPGGEICSSPATVKLSGGAAPSSAGVTQVCSTLSTIGVSLIADEEWDDKGADSFAGAGSAGSRVDLSCGSLATIGTRSAGNGSPDSTDGTSPVSGVGVQLNVDTLSDCGAIANAAVAMRLQSRVAIAGNIGAYTVISGTVDMKWASTNPTSNRAHG